MSGGLSGGAARLALRRVALALLLAGPLLALACSGKDASEGVSWVDNADCAEVIREVVASATISLATIDAVLTVSVEVAETAEERQRGLQCRAVVPAGSGMLFRMPGESTTGFWVHNTYVPLDLLYLDPGGLVLHAASMKPCLRVGDETLPTWRSRCIVEAAPHAPSGAYEGVLELPTGWLESNGMTPSTLPGRGRVTVGDE